MDFLSIGTHLIAPNRSYSSYRCYMSHICKAHHHLNPIIIEQICTFAFDQNKKCKKGYIDKHSKINQINNNIPVMFLIDART